MRTEPQDLEGKPRGWANGKDLSKDLGPWGQSLVDGEPEVQSGWVS